MAPLTRAAGRADMRAANVLSLQADVAAGPAPAICASRTLCVRAMLTRPGSRRWRRAETEEAIAPSP